MNDRENFKSEEPSGPKFSDTKVRELLLSALESNDLDGFSTLLDEYPHCRVDEYGGESLLKSAGHEGMLSFVKKLVQSGANINHGIDEVGSPVAFAAANGHLKTVRWMVENGAIINDKTGGVLECRPLKNAAMQGQFEMVKLLVELGIQIRDKEVNRQASQLSLLSGDEEIKRYIEQFSE